MGLIRALEALHPLDVHTIDALPGWKALLGYFGLNVTPVKTLPSPDLIIGAGHGTHLSMLMAKRSRGGRTVVLMKQSLPTDWFDLCVIPEHDDVPVANNIMLTHGVLNTIVPGKEQDAAKGLILIGGPSSHYQWDETQLASALQLIVSHDEIHWMLTTSRRTPDTAVEKLRSLSSDKLELIPWQQTRRNWVAEQLKTASKVWITEDSVSMLYEALTSGATCGILPVPHTKDSRISDSVQKMVKDRVVTSFTDWQASGALDNIAASFNEAARVAGEIKQRWFSLE